MTDIIGKTVLISITCVGQDGKELDRFQTVGTIEESDERWIGIRRPGMSELFGLPPNPELLEPAEEMTYMLEATREVIEQPDFLATLSVNVGDPESLLELRGVGYVPEG